MADTPDIDAAVSTPPSRWTEAHIDRVTTRTPRVVSIFLNAVVAPHEAGQHLDVRLTAPDGYQAQRSYSIASEPGAAMIELAIERLDDGEVSPYFFDVAQPGDTIDVRGPIGGHFIWRRGDGGPLLLIGGGSGIVPLMAMLRHRAALASDVATLLVYSSRTWEDVIFRDELIAMESGDRRLSLVINTTRGPRQRAADIDRRLDRALLRALLDHWSQTAKRVYVCGSNAFVEAITGALVLERVPPSIIRTERFGGSAPPPAEGIVSNGR